MRILHVLRAPIGGLARHVRDLARGQSARGHEVGLICDDDKGDAAKAYLKEMAPFCKLGIYPIAITRTPHPSDISGIKTTSAIAASTCVDFIHGHGAKGGFFARAAGTRTRIKSLYTPHGGSLHYRWTTPAGGLFLAAEKYMAAQTSGFIFVCDFERRAFEERVGLKGRPYRVIHNGLWPEEFISVAPQATMTDLLYVGEMRKLKGVDLLLDALMTINQHRPTQLTLVGDGPDLDVFKAQSLRNGLAAKAHFVGRKPLTEALKLGRMMVIPSRLESFPYIVLETIAANIPLLTTDVGGIPEILPRSHLVQPGSLSDLINHLNSALQHPDRLKDFSNACHLNIKQNFTADGMVDSGLKFMVELNQTVD